MHPGSENPIEEQKPGEPAETAAAPGNAEAGGPQDGDGAKGEEPKKPAKSSAREWAETLVVALLVALVIRTFVVQVYLVEGPSMEPTLHTFERVFVNKLVYRFREPKPGEIIVLQDPNRPQRELIKRVVAVSGETIEIKKGIVYVNGQALREPYINTAIKSSADMQPLTVPEKQVFVMGDNRGMSFDSRAIGPIGVNKIDGKAFFMFWPIDKFGYGPLDQPREIDPTLSSTK